MSWNGKHQDIGGIQSGVIDDIVEDGLDLTSTDFDQEEIEAIPDLVRTVKDVHQDLENKSVAGALKKLGWYFTKGPMAGLQTEDEIVAYLDANSVPGAYKINNEKAVEMQLGLLALHKQIQRNYKQIQQQFAQAPSIMYK